MGDQRSDVQFTKLRYHRSLPDTRANGDKARVHLRQAGIITMVTALDRCKKARLLVLLDQGPWSRIHGGCRSDGSGDTGVFQLDDTGFRSSLTGRRAAL